MKSEKDKWTAFILCTFFGVLGVHRFYVGKIGTGVLYLMTCGGFFIGSFIDWITILTGNFKDNEGNVLK